MRKILTLLFFILCSLSAIAMTPKQAISNTIKQQTMCWNEQDLKCVVMKFYAQNATYPSPTGPIIGRDAIYEIYAKRFSNAGHHIQLGKLQLTSSSYFHQLGLKAALSIIHYKLNLHHKIYRGYSTLTWIKQGNRWLILSDQPVAITHQ